MRTRDFITLLGAAATAWPIVARAQQDGRMRRLGVLIGNDENDPFTKSTLSAFTRGLAELGWTDGRNVRMDVRWAADNIDRARMFAKEFVDLRPDVILANITPVTAALQRETRTIPIVFANISDLVGSGIVASLPRLGGNLTGFINLEAGSYFLPSFEAAAQALKVEHSAAVANSLGATPEMHGAQDRTFLKSRRIPAYFLAGVVWSGASLPMAHLFGWATAGSVAHFGGHATNRSITVRRIVERNTGMSNDGADKRIRGRGGDIDGEYPQQ
jgi:hypothetical protein